VSSRTQVRWARGLLTVTGANVLVFGMTSLAALLMPLVLDVREYAYWQLFSLYTSLLGFFVLGFNDGVYLNHSHQVVEQHRGLFKAFLEVVGALGVVGALTLSLVAGLVAPEKRFAVAAAAACVLFYGANGYAAYLNQMRLQFGRYSGALVLERAVFLLAVVCLFAGGAHDYRLFVIASVGAALVKLAFNAASNWSVVAARGTPLAAVRPQIAANFRQGFLLMVAVLMCGSVLVPARLVVERTSGIESFGIFSFALTAVSVVTLCVVSVGQILYPMFRRLAPEHHPPLLELVHRVATGVSLVALCLFFLVELLVPVVYGQYAGMLTYLAFLFPTCVFQSKYILLVLTEQKLEHAMVRAVLGAVSGVAVNLLVSLVAWALLGSVEAIAAACLVGYALWFYPWWLDLLRRRGLAIGAGAFVDLLVVGAFVVAAVVVPSVLGPGPWDRALSCAVYLVVAAAVGARGWVEGRRRWAAFRHLAAA